jgi:hypothetical protein
MGLDKVQSLPMNVSAPQQQTETKRPPSLPTLQEIPKPLNVSFLQIPSFSTRTKVEIAAVTLLLAYRASTLAATGTTPAIVAVVSIYLAYKIYQIGLKNILTYFGQNAIGVAATVVLGPDGSRLDPADEMEAAGEATLENLGAVGMFIIPHPQEAKKEEPLPPEAEPEEDLTFVDTGLVGIFVMPTPKQPKVEQAPVQQQQEPEEEEVDNWAASMGGIFFGFIQAVGFLFLM